MVRRQPSESYRGFRTAGIRMNEEMLPELQSHRTGKVTESLAGFHAFDKAQLVMLTEEGLIPEQDGIAMLRALREMEAIGIEKARAEAEGGMHSGEQYLIRKLGEDVGGRIHLGRSSGDLGQIGKRYPMRAHLLRVLEELNRFRATLLRLSAEHADTVMPGYTHGQHAQPTTYGHWLAMWAQVFGRDFDRGAELYRRVNQSPTGAAILTGSNFPINRHRTAELMGFDEPIPNTMDAILSQDTALECASVLAIHASNMGRLADDLMLWSTSEFGMIDVPDRFCGTSSIMMQKKNPQAPQEVKGVAAEALGTVVLVGMANKGSTGLPQLEHKYSDHAFWSLFKEVIRNLDWMRELLAAAEIDRERMLASAGAHWAQATDVAGSLVREKGLPWRTAHQIVGILVRHSHERGFAPSETTPELIDEAAIEYMGEPVHLSAEALADALNPAVFVAGRTLYGGPAPEALHRELGQLETKLHADEAFVQEKRAQIQEAEAKLEHAIDTLVTGVPQHA